MVNRKVRCPNKIIETNKLIGKQLGLTMPQTIQLKEEIFAHVLKKKVKRGEKFEIFIKK